MARRRWRWLLVGSAVAATAVAAVLATSAYGSHKASNILLDGTTETVTNIDPAGNYDYGTATVDYMIFNRLLAAGPGKNLAPHPELATKCYSVKNLATWACNLRHGVKFSNGDSFTSADVKFSFDRTIKINDPSGISSLLANLKKTTTSGAYKVVFHLKHAQSTWPQVLTTSAGSMAVDHKLYPADKLLPNTAQQVGTGPYILTKYTPNVSAVFKVNPNYWGPKPKNGGLVITYYKDSATMKLDLQSGHIDMAFDAFAPQEVTSLQHNSSVKVYLGAGSGIRYLVFDVGSQAKKLGVPTSKLAVRQAIAYLFPRQTIASRVYHGQVKPLYSMVPAGLPGHIDAFKKLYGAKPSVAKARAVLKKAHIKTPLKFTIWYTPSHYGPASADEYAEIQRALNGSKLFNVSLKTAEWAQYVNSLGSTKGVFQLGWFPDYVDGEDYINPFYPKGQFLSNGYVSSAFNKLQLKEEGAKSEKARIKILKQEQMLAAKDVPLIPYWQNQMVAAARKNVSGIPSTLDPTYIMRFWLISKS
jgi:peptide/nickel transport system substrate-binding protein